MGVLSLKILDRALPEGIDITINESGNPFNIQLTEDGSLYVANYQVKINGEIVQLHTTYNSKSNYPFYACVDYCDYQVFDEGGEFTDEFIEQFKVPA